MQVRILLDAEFFDPPEVDGAGAAVGAVDHIALGQQEFGQIGAILARDARNYRSFLHIHTPTKTDLIKLI